MSTTWKVCLLGLVAILAVSGCAQQKQGAHPSSLATLTDAEIDHITQCPICNTQWTGKDNGYGSGHYFNEIELIAESYRAQRMSGADATGRIARIRGNREEFWNTVPAAAR